jgi:hypothetical protein
MATEPFSLPDPAVNAGPSPRGDADSPAHQVAADPLLRLLQRAAETEDALVARWAAGLLLRGQAATESSEGKRRTDEVKAAEHLLRRHVPRQQNRKA